MKTNRNTCDPLLINRFFDKELEPEESNRVKDHMDSCPECKEQFEHLGLISRQIKNHIDEKVSQTPFTQNLMVENRVLAYIEKKSLPWWKRAIERAFSKPILIPATAVASLALILFTVFRQPVISGPSAIVTSVSGDTASVIILETVQTHHTIVWFTEESSSERPGV